MSMGWQPLVQILVCLLLVYAMMLIALWLYVRKHPETVTMKDALRLLPDLLRLLKRLAGDKTVSTGVRIRIFLLLVYLLLPIDLVPDFVPIIGYADDVIIVAMVLRSVVRLAGTGPLEKHWPGSAEGLGAVLELAGLRKSGR